MEFQAQVRRKERFCEFLNYLKSERGFSLSKVAESIGISVQGLYKINRGESNPSKQTVLLLQIKYGLNPIWYEKGIEEMEINPTRGFLDNSDEIMLELLAMKNKRIGRLNKEYSNLRKEHALLKKTLRPVKKKSRAKH
ncbi:MAG: helix-turn-helix transcriptional regulator [SAR324 cluster bacterium]|nr:helix-turn-helix transcriptional regulator [SAR324 cluster bacterium]